MVKLANKDRGLRAVDLFSGCGGLTLGFEREGFTTLLGVELNPQQAATFEANHRDIPVIRRDIRRVSNELVQGHLAGNRVDVIIAGPPCEGFSIAGNRDEDDPRNDLFVHVVRLAKALEPAVILIENVPGLLSMKNGQVIQEIHRRLRGIGYEPAHTVLNASRFGVPQNRSRLFVVSTRDGGGGDIIRALEGVNVGEVNVKDAIGDLPPLEPGEEKTRYEIEPFSEYQVLMREGDVAALTSHRAVNHRPFMIERFKCISPGEGMTEAWDRIPEKFRPRKPYSARCRRLDPSKPSPTVTAHCLDELIHPDQDRQITPREAARLQSFPDTYVFTGRYVVFHGSSEQDRYEQIGDAVPPLLAQAIAREIRKYL